MSWADLETRLNPPESELVTLVAIDGTPIIMNDWYIVNAVELPEYDQEIERVELLAPEKVTHEDESIEFFQVWSIVSLTNEEKIIMVEAARDEKAAQIVEDFQAQVAPLEAAYPLAERESWDAQVQEATAYQLDNNAPTPLMDAMLGQRAGVTKDALVSAILNNAAAYKVTFGSALGTKQAREDALAAVDAMSLTALAEISSV